jgi:hypothetical protein
MTASTTIPFQTQTLYPAGSTRRKTHWRWAGGLAALHSAWRWLIPKLDCRKMRRANDGTTRRNQRSVGIDLDRLVVVGQRAHEIALEPPSLASVGVSFPVPGIETNHHIVIVDGAIEIALVYARIGTIDVTQRILRSDSDGGVEIGERSNCSFGNVRYSRRPRQVDDRPKLSYNYPRRSLPDRRLPGPVAKSIRRESLHLAMAQDILEKC